MTGKDRSSYGWSFSIREVLCLMLLVSVCLTWWLEYSNRFNGRIIVAAREIDIGDVIDSDTIRWVIRPTDKIPDAASTSHDVLGKYAAQRLKVGEPILMSHLGTHDPDPRGTYLRGRIISFKATSLDAGIQRGDEVDLIVVDMQAGKARTVASQATVFSLEKPSPFDFESPLDAPWDVTVVALACDRDRLCQALLSGEGETWMVLARDQTEELDRTPVDSALPSGKPLLGPKRRP